MQLAQNMFIMWPSEAHLCEAAYEYMKGNPMVKSNVLKLTTDGLFAALFMMLFGMKMLKEIRPPSFFTRLRGSYRPVGDRYAPWIAPSRVRGRLWN